MKATVTVNRIDFAGGCYIVTVAADGHIIFYGFNSDKVASVTPKRGHEYILEGQPARPPFARPTVGEIVAAFEEMAVEIDSPTSHLRCEGCGNEISEPNGGWPHGYTAYYCPCGHETEIANT